MSLKAFIILAPVALGGMWVGGVFGGSYSRTVDRPPAQVLAAISDLDIRQQPGAPGTDPSRSGGVPSLFRSERTADGIAFVVMSGAHVATRMIVHLEPVDNGALYQGDRRQVARGDAPDDEVAPSLPLQW